MIKIMSFIFQVQATRDVCAIGTCCLFGLQLPRRWGSFDFFCCHSGKNFWANLCVTFRGNHGQFSQCCKWTNASENL